MSSPPSARSLGDDDDLMMRYIRGDEAAFETLYSRHERGLYGFCLHFVGESEAAADAFQETFKRLIDSSGSYQPEGRFRSWLFTLARRACLDQLRSSRRSESLATDAMVGAADPAASGAADRVVAAVEAGRLLALLPTEQREVLLLSKYYGFGYAEIAQMLGSSQVAVKQKAYRALKALRAHIGAEKP